MRKLLILTGVGVTQTLKDFPRIHPERSGRTVIAFLYLGSMRRTAQPDLGHEISSH